MPTGKTEATLRRLLEIMRRLRDPRSGCPWDRAQDSRSIAPYTLEEAYEVVDAIEQDDPELLRDELGDLLFQVVFHAHMAEERGLFGFADVATAIADKLERRHPHVFGDVEITDVDTQSVAWEAHKDTERQQRGYHGVLAGVPLALPALTRAVKLQKRAARIGLDWPSADQVLEKLQEELAELAAARAQASSDDVSAELGDVLFTCVNLARHLDVDPEAALRAASGRFTVRVARVEAGLPASGERLSAIELDALWNAAKDAEL